MRFTVALLVLAYTAVISVVAVVINYSTGAGIETWDRAGSLASIAIALVTLLIAIGSGFYRQRSTAAVASASTERERLAIRLIRSFSSVERLAKAYAERHSARGSVRHLSLRDIADLMTSSGVWETQDRVPFDLATRARNSIVHGDLEEVDVIDLEYANEKLEQLIAKMENAAKK